MLFFIFIIIFQIVDLLNRGESGKIELNKTLCNLLQEMQLLESFILKKSDTISIVTASVDSYHNAISNHINEVFYIFLIQTF